jgi:hypothetical protein
MKTADYFYRTQEGHGLTVLEAYKEATGNVKRFRLSHMREQGAPQMQISRTERDVDFIKNLTEKDFSKGSQFLNKQVKSYQLLDTVIGHTLYDDVSLITTDGDHLKITMRKNKTSCVKQR